MGEKLSLEDFKALVDEADTGYMIADGEGLIQYTNDAYLRAVAGQEELPMVGRYMQEYIDSGSIKRSSMLMAIEQKRKVSLLTVIRNNKTAYVASTPFFDENGKVYKVITKARDETELEDLKKQVRLLESYVDKKQLEGEGASDYGSDIVVVGQKMRDAMELAKKVKDVNSTILLLGDSGVGKEIVAQYIHRNSVFKGKPFIAVNCSALSETLLESELFGYVEGSFTGASKQGKKGLFEAAQDGILFLDEIGDISPNLQVKLLRAIEDKSICRVGDYKTIPVNVRIIAATNKNLKEMVYKKTFREDLYYRLNVVSINIPPLRQRRSDILPLLLFYLNRYNHMYNMQKKLSKDVLSALQIYKWPGNVRELKNVVESLVVTSEGSLIRQADLDRLKLEEELEEITSGENISIQVNELVPLEHAVSIVEKQLLLKAKQRYGSSRKIAQHLQVSRATISRKLNKYGIQEE